VRPANALSNAVVNCADSMWDAFFVEVAARIHVLNALYYCVKLPLTVNRSPAAFTSQYVVLIAVVKATWFAWRIAWPFLFDQNPSVRPPVLQSAGSTGYVDSWTRRR
jgi:hypothetical protein